MRFLPTMQCAHLEKKADFRMWTAFLSLVRVSPRRPTRAHPITFEIRQTLVWSFYKLACHRPAQHYQNSLDRTSFSAPDSGHPPRSVTWITVRIYKQGRVGVFSSLDLVTYPTFETTYGTQDSTSVEDIRGVSR